MVTKKKKNPFFFLFTSLGYILNLNSNLTSKRFCDSFFTLEYVLNCFSKNGWKLHNIYDCYSMSPHKSNPLNSSMIIFMKVSKAEGLNLLLFNFLFLKKSTRKQSLVIGQSFTKGLTQELKNKKPRLEALIIEIIFKCSFNFFNLIFSFFEMKYQSISSSSPSTFCSNPWF